MFSTPPKTNFIFSVTFNLSSANVFILDQSYNLSFGKGSTTFNGLKTSWEKWKTNVIIILISLMIFLNSFRHKYHDLNDIELVVYKCF